LGTTSVTGPGSSSSGSGSPSTSTALATEPKTTAVAWSAGRSFTA
jgi:hypothetical protein